MKIKIQKETPTIGHYYLSDLDYYLIKLKGEVLSWFLFDEEDYFNLSIEKPKDEYTDCLILIMIHRDPVDNPIYFENDKDKHDLIKYPWVIKTTARDDCAIGWRFETKHQLISYYNYMVKTINKTETFVEKDFDYFLQFFKENQIWSN